MDRLVSSPERLKDANEFMANLPPSLSFGNKFLDDATDGIFADDLIVVTARTGAGKTECVANIAAANAIKGKHVSFFALEAHTNEIELRIKFKMLSQAFFQIEEHWKSRGLEAPNYQRWIAGKQTEQFKRYVPEVDEEFERKYKTLHTFYRDQSFSSDTFEGELARIKGETDLIILDHLHYFDLDPGNEVEGLKKTLKQIKTVVSQYRKPTILVVHIRKQDKRHRGLLPDNDEIHGSSDITKIATRVLAVGPAHDQQTTIPYVFPTYFKLLKNRWDGSRCRFVGLVGFDVQKNCYNDNYQLGKFSADESEFTIIDDPKEKPNWAL